MTSVAASYGEIIAANVRAARGRVALSQTETAERMASLGFAEWRFQTVGQIEKGKRRVAAVEVMALAWVLETTIATLMSPHPDDDDVMMLPGGEVISTESVRLSCKGCNDRTVAWKDDGTPVFAQRGIIGT